MAKLRLPAINGVWLALGVVIGAVGALALTGGPKLVTASKSVAAPANADLSAVKGLDRAQLAHLLSARLANTLVFDASPGTPLRHGASFYDTPKPYGDILCRVDRYTFAEKAVRGRPTQSSDDWADMLEIKRFYGLWRSPSDPEGKGRDQACPAFRDFRHLIGGDGLAVERAATQLDKVFADARQDKVAFELTCTDRRAAPEGKPCDGLAFLKSLSLDQIASVAPESQTKDARLYIDSIVLRPKTGKGCGGGGEFTNLRLTTRGPYINGEGVEALDIALIEEC